MEEEAHKVAVVVVPFPAQGHLNQLLSFCLYLSSHGSGRIQVHYASSATHNRQVKARFYGWDLISIPNIHFHDLPLPPFPTPPPDTTSPLKFPSHLQPLFNASVHMKVPLSSLLFSLSATFRRVVIVHEPLTSFASHAAAMLPNIESFRFLCVPAYFNLSYSLLWNDKHIADGPRPSKAVLDMILAPFEDECTEEFFNFAKQQDTDTTIEAGWLINTCRLIEGEFIDLLAQYQNKKLFAIGPTFPVSTVKATDGQPHHCVEWLDKQPLASVIYVSFGTLSTISDEQIEQLAIGLKHSGQRFLWVLRDADRGNIFAAEDDGNRRKLPLGFEETTEGVGIVVTDWVPQLEILSHPSTGSFMSHCGWNSCMESFTMGVPIIAWPMHSDQPRNALVVTEYLKVGVLVREWAQRAATVQAEQIEESIRRVMVLDEGQEIRRRIKTLSEGIRQSVMEGGSSREELNSFIAHITR